ncbi:MAG: octaprenyl diphosphate synthase, partial [Proteobacteria bacterium]|nr:octaprenyl diphosphate synthase [Pseudomonadota bacterium]
MNIQAIRLLVEPELDLVTDLMQEMTKSEIGIIDDLAQHIMQSGGKRLRPILVLLSSNLCNYVGDEHIKLAAMVELFHTATLLHDDVVDDSSLRRGRKTAHEIWGNSVAI